MYHVFWFDEDGDPHHSEAETLPYLIAQFGTEDDLKSILIKQYQPAMCSGAILIQGSEMLWDFSAPISDYVPEDFTPGEDDENPNIPD